MVIIRPTTAISWICLSEQEGLSPLWDDHFICKPSCYNTLYSSLILFNWLVTDDLTAVYTKNIMSMFHTTEIWHLNLCKCQGIYLAVINYYLIWIPISHFHFMHQCNHLTPQSWKTSSSQYTLPCYSPITFLTETPAICSIPGKISSVWICRSGISKWHSLLTSLRDSGYYWHHSPELAPPFKSWSVYSWRLSSTQGRKREASEKRSGQIENTQRTGYRNGGIPWKLVKES